MRLPSSPRSLFQHVATVAFVFARLSVDEDKGSIFDDCVCERPKFRADIINHEKIDQNQAVWAADLDEKQTLSREISTTIELKESRTIVAIFWEIVDWGGS